MKVNIEVELRGFNVPNFVIIEAKLEEKVEAQSIPLSSLEAVTLHKMCEEFRNEVFKKAGKSQPPRSA